MKKISFRPLVLPLMLAVCSLFYYFGELVDWAAWDAVRNNFFYGIHDVHRLLFLAPIVYAGYTARIRGAVIITLISFIIFLPRAFFISPYPDPLLRMVIFTVFAGVIGCLVGAMRNHMARANLMETKVAVQGDRMREIVNSMADGIVITGVDYKIRFNNARMVTDFGDGTGQTCYAHLKDAAAPCPECRIAAVIGGHERHRWQCRCVNGKTYDVMAVPFVDADCKDCQVAIFRDVTPSEAD
jgi:hypothetical protein